MALRSLRDAGLAREQSRKVLIANLARQQSEEAKTEAEGHEVRALRPVTQHRHWYAHATLTLTLFQEARSLA